LVIDNNLGLAQLALKTHEFSACLNGASQLSLIAKWLSFFAGSSLLASKFLGIVMIFRKKISYKRFLKLLENFTDKYRKSFSFTGLFARNFYLHGK
jgi:hypothetical protein